MIEINTGILDGIQGKAVKVEVEILNGLPSFIVIGLGDTVIKEAGERIKSAIKASGFTYPKGKIVVNLSPATIRKKGSHMELAVAIGILAASGQIRSEGLDRIGFFGELSLGGSILPCQGILPMALCLETEGVRKLVLPEKEDGQYKLISQEKYLSSSLKDVVEAINNGSISENYREGLHSETVDEINLDFAQVKGQDEAKRAIAVAAAGYHNMVMVGGSGAGKSMLAKRIPTILPKLNKDDMCEVMSIYSALGKELSRPDMSPFRAPYYKISTSALIGGGNEPLPGEISLAHKGVLFLDELGEYSISVLDSLRTPLEDKKVNLNRRGNIYTFPADFLLVGASNLCKCGNYGSKEKKCICGEYQIMQYKKKLMGPVAGRIQIHIYVPDVSFEQYTGKDELSSAIMRDMVYKCREIQTKRYINEGINTNSQLEGELLIKYCPLTDEAKNYLKLAYSSLKLNPRTCENVIKVARTIADINNEEKIGSDSILEALSYRDLEKIYGRED